MARAYNNYGYSDDDIRALQNALVGAGQSVGSAGSDGKYGSDTAAAVSRAGYASLDDAINGLVRGGSSNGGVTVNDYSYLETMKNAQGASTPFKSEWEPAVRNAANNLMNSSYDDWRKGDTYQGLVERYGKNGQRSMQNTLAQVSARTGGLASSYAEQAAQQEYDRYMQNLEDAAYNMYNNDRNNMINNLNVAKSLYDSDYNRYADELNRNIAAENTAYGRQLDMAQLMASAGDFTGYKNLGYTDDQIKKLTDAYNASLVAAGSGGGGRGGSGGSKAKNSAGYKDVLSFVKGKTPTEAESYINRMVDQGYITPDEGAYIYQVVLGGGNDNGQNYVIAYQGGPEPKNHYTASTALRLASQRYSGDSDRIAELGRMKAQGLINETTYKDLVSAVKNKSK